MAKRACEWSAESKEASKKFSALKNLCEDRSLEGFSEFGLDNLTFKRIPAGLQKAHSRDLSTADFLQHIQKAVRTKLLINN